MHLMHVITPKEVANKMTRIFTCGFIVAIIMIVWVCLAAIVMFVRVLG